MSKTKKYNLNVKEQNIIFSKFSKKLIHEKLEMKDGVLLDWYYLDSSDSVLIVPLTKQKELVLINQNRFNLKECVNEFPAGGIVGDLSRTSSKKSAIKELFEETGYIAEEMIFLGKFYALPSETNRWIHIYLAYNVTHEAEPVLDNVIEKYFDITVNKHKIEDVLNGKIILKGIEHNFALTLAEKYLKSKKII